MVPGVPKSGGLSLSGATSLAPRCQLFYLSIDRNSVFYELDMTLVDVRTPDPKRFIPGATGDWEIVIGMEVHAQVLSNSKLFSGASTTFGNAPNSNVSLVDAAMPGMLPVINEECVAQAVRTGLGLKAQINKRSIFDRKNYFYPDLPQGYQISQFKDPIVGEGKIIISLGPDRQGNFEDIEIGIERLHLEQDAGKSMHDQHPTMSYVDLNRSGVALMEIVSKPDMRSSDEAKAYMTKLRSIVRYLGTCDGNMDEGSMRADVNVSVRKPGGEFGTRCEIKNVNSIRFIGQAIEYEARRQIAILEDGGSIDQETRLFDPGKGETRSMRSKEDAHDYRYFPDPDLLPLEFDDAFIEKMGKDLPELPDDKKARFVRELGLSVYDASILVSEKAIADYYELVAEGRDGKIAANWVINDLLGALNKSGKGIEETPISAEQLGGIIDLIKANTISGKIAKDLFEIVWNEGGNPAEIVDARGMKQVTDTGAIEKAVDEIIAANPDQVEKVKAKPTLAGWFVGQVMKATGGKANPQAVQDLVKAKLGIEE
jgi:aspartyl-tRNA(Asn)/glutamyl-tRNA(Gln) amidotransferase subunit B